MPALLALGSPLVVSSALRVALEQRDSELFAAAAKACAKALSELSSSRLELLEEFLRAAEALDPQRGLLLLEEWAASEEFLQLLREVWGAPGATTLYYRIVLYRIVSYRIVSYCIVLYCIVL